MRLGPAEDKRCEAEDEQGLVLQSTSNAADTSMNLSVDVPESLRLASPKTPQKYIAYFCTQGQTNTLFSYLIKLAWSNQIGPWFYFGGCYS